MITWVLVSRHSIENRFIEKNALGERVVLCGLTGIEILSSIKTTVSFFFFFFFSFF